MAEDKTLTSQSLIEELYRQAQQPTPQPSTTLSTISSGLGLLGNVLGAATGRGALGQGFSQLSQQQQRQELSRARLAQIGRGQKLATIQSLIPKVQKAEKEAAKQQRIGNLSALVTSPEARQAFNLSELDAKIIQGLAEASPDKAAEYFKGLLTGESKLREFKVRKQWQDKIDKGKFKNLTKTERIAQRMAEDSSVKLEQAILDAGVSLKERKEWLEDDEKLLKNLPFVTPVDVTRERLFGIIPLPPKKEFILKPRAITASRAAGKAAPQKTLNVQAPAVPQPGPAFSTFNPLQSAAGATPARTEAIDQLTREGQLTPEAVGQRAQAFQTIQRDALRDEAIRVLTNNGRPITPESIQTMMQILSNAQAR